MTLNKDGLEAAHAAYAKTTGGMLEGRPMANAITAYLSALPSDTRTDADGGTWSDGGKVYDPPALPSVKVKALEWEDDEDRWTASHAWGEEEIIYDGSSDNPFGWFVGGVWFWCKTLEEAQTNAQSKFNTRVLSALEPAESVEGEAVAWHDIATAPEGEQILVWETDYGWLLACKDRHHSSGWAIKSSGNFYASMPESVVAKLTHWRPLGSAPSHPAPSPRMTKLWGKSQDDLDAERQEMRAYAELAEQQNATPEQLGRHYGNKLRPVSIRHFDGSTIRDCYFGTDIPAPTWREIEEYRAKHGQDDAGHGGGWIIAATLVALLALVAIGAMMF